MKYLTEEDYGFSFNCGKYRDYLLKHINKIGENYVNLCIENEFFHDYCFRDINFQLCEDYIAPYGGKHILTMELSQSRFNDRQCPTFIIKYNGVESVKFDFDSKYMRSYIWGEITCKKGYIYHEIRIEGGSILIKAKKISAEKLL